MDPFVLTFGALVLIILILKRPTTRHEAKARKPHGATYVAAAAEREGERAQTSVPRSFADELGYLALNVAPRPGLGGLLNPRKKYSPDELAAILWERCNKDECTIIGDRPLHTSDLAVVLPQHLLTGYLAASDGRRLSRELAGEVDGEPLPLAPDDPPALRVEAARFRIKRSVFILQTQPAPESVSQRVCDMTRQRWRVRRVSYNRPRAQLREAAGYADGES